MRYVKSLDGIRAIAVFMVMLFHFGYFGAGWVGVQIFFTLSGYLITSILLEDRDSDFVRFIGRFYWRRTLRIFPLFYFFLLIVALVYALTGAPASFLSDWIWLFTYTANFARLRDVDLAPSLVHTWSLALEEQFYLIWPILLYLLRVQSFKWVVAGFLVLSPVVRLIVYQGFLELGHDVQTAGKAAYVLPFTQFDAFAAGAAIQLWGLHRLRYAGRWFLVTGGVTGLAGLGVLVASHFWGDGAYVSSLGYGALLGTHHQYVWGYSLINLLSMLSIICALQRIGPVAVLENKLIVRFGKVSYGVYVYHLPLLMVCQFIIVQLEIEVNGFVRLCFFAIWAVAVFVVSEASFRWLETPFLKLKDKPRIS